MFEIEPQPDDGYGVEFRQSKRILFYENWLFHIQWQHQFHVLTCIIEPRCDIKPFDGLLQIDYDIFFSFRFGCSIHRRFLCHFFGLSINLFASIAIWRNWNGKKYGIDFKTGRTLYKSNQYRRTLVIPREILLIVINLVLLMLSVEKWCYFGYSQIYIFIFLSDIKIFELYGESFSIIKSNLRAYNFFFKQKSSFNWDQDYFLLNRKKIA